MMKIDGITKGTFHYLFYMMTVMRSMARSSPVNYYLGLVDQVLERQRKKLLSMYYKKEEEDVCSKFSYSFEAVIEDVCIEVTPVIEVRSVIFPLKGGGRVKGLRNKKDEILSVLEGKKDKPEKQYDPVLNGGKANFVEFICKYSSNVSHKYGSLSKIDKGFTLFGASLDVMWYGKKFVFSVDSEYRRKKFAENAVSVKALTELKKVAMDMGIGLTTKNSKKMRSKNDKKIPSFKFDCKKEFYKKVAEMKIEDYQVEYANNNGIHFCFLRVRGYSYFGYGTSQKKAMRRSCSLFIEEYGVSSKCDQIRAFLVDWARSNGDIKVEFYTSQYQEGSWCGFRSRLRLGDYDIEGGLCDDKYKAEESVSAFMVEVLRTERGCFTSIDSERNVRKYNKLKKSYNQSKLVGPFGQYVLGSQAYHLLMDDVLEFCNYRKTVYDERELLEKECMDLRYYDNVNPHCAENFEVPISLVYKDDKIHAPIDWISIDSHTYLEHFMLDKD